jgi:hypothetical protein
VSRESGGRHSGQSLLLGNPAGQFAKSLLPVIDSSIHDKKLIVFYNSHDWQCALAGMVERAKAWLLQSAEPIHSGEDIVYHSKVTGQDFQGADYDH